MEDEAYSENTNQEEGKEEEVAGKKRRMGRRKILGKIIDRECAEREQARNERKEG